MFYVLFGFFFLSVLLLIPLTSLLGLGGGITR